MPNKIRARAQTSQLSPAGTNGEPIDVVVNEFGELVMAGFDWAAGAPVVSLSSSDADRWIELMYVLTNVPNATPDETITIEMNGFTSCSVQVKKTSGADTFIWTMWSSAEGSGAADQFFDSTQYGWTSAATAPAATYTTDGLLFPVAGFTPSAHRVKIATAGTADDADFEVYVKKFY